MYEARQQGINAAEKDYRKGNIAGLTTIKAQYTSYALDAAVNAYTARMAGLRTGVARL